MRRCSRSHACCCRRWLPYPPLSELGRVLRSLKSCDVVLYQAGALEDLQVLGYRRLADVGAEQLDLSRTRPHVAVDLVEQCGLAGAIWTDDQAALARPYRQRYALRYDQAAKRLGQVGHFKGVVGCQWGHIDPCAVPSAVCSGRGRFLLASPER